MITGIRESKTLTKHILCDCKCKFGSSKCSSNQKWNNNVSAKIQKNIMREKKTIFGILLHVLVKMANI